MFKGKKGREKGENQAKNYFGGFESRQQQHTETETASSSYSFFGVIALAVKCII